MTEANDSKTLLRLMRSRIYNRNSSDSLSYYEVYRRFRTKYLIRHDLLDEEKLLIHLGETVGLFNEDLGDLFSRISVFTRIIQDHCHGNNFNVSRHSNLLWSMRSATPLSDASDYDLNQCEDCDGYDNYDEMIFIEGSGEITVCQSCCDNDYSYSEQDGMYYHNEDYPDYDDDYDDEHNERDIDEYGKHYYKTCVVGFMQGRGLTTGWINEGMRLPSDDKDEMLMGLESEFRLRDDHDLEDVVSDIHSQMKGFAIVKNDGSLGDDDTDSGEIVTIPATLKAQKYMWSKFCESKHNFAGRIKAWHSRDCGIHIHIDRRSVTPLEIGKLLIFINGGHNADFINQFAGRASATYCERSPKSVKEGLESNRNRYEALNNGNSKTVEFRIFRGNIAKQGVLRNLEFVHALVQFVKQSAYDNHSDRIIELTYEKFADYVSMQNNRGVYPYLYKWLVKNDFSQPKINNTIRENEVNECA